MDISDRVLKWADKLQSDVADAERELDISLRTLAKIRELHGYYNDGLLSENELKEKMLTARQESELAFMKDFIKEQEGLTEVIL